MIIKENLQSPLLTKADKVAEVLRGILNSESEIDRDKEHFWVIGLSSRLMVKYIDLVSLGSLTSTVVEPREVFRLAVLKGVHSIIVAHNHPGGTLEFGAVDRRMTNILIEAGKILNIPVLDHILVTEDGHLSYQDMNY